MKQEVKQDMIKILKEGVAGLKEKKSATYKQKIEIEIDVPVGMKIDQSEFIGESYNGDSKDYSISFKPKAKQGAELNGVLCGVSDTSMINAKEHAEAGCHINIIERYNTKFYVTTAGYTWSYAYPVPAAKLNQLITELEK
jgi:hypothetical protein